MRRATCSPIGRCRMCTTFIPDGLHRYPPGTTHNTEHVFGLQLPQQVAVQLSPREHLSYQWLPWDDAADKVFSPSNRAAILQLPERIQHG